MKQYFINRTNLKSLMIAQSITRYDMCKYLNITYQSLTAKLKGRSEFSEEEISILYALFGADIFLPMLATKHEAGKEEDKRDYRRKRKVSH